MTGQEQCIKLFVLTVEKNAKYPSSPQREGQSTVKHVGKNIDLQEEDTEDIRNQILISNNFLVFV